MSQQTQKSQDSTVVESNTEPDYSAVNIPTKAPSSFNYVERRAEILQLVEQAGHPASLNQAELADRYEVSQQQISKDLDRLDEHVRARLGNRRDLELESVLKRCMTGALQDEDWSAARKAAEAYNEYVDGRIKFLEFRNRLNAVEDIAERKEGSR